jgi:hypothetical protein
MLQRLHRCQLPLNADGSPYQQLAGMHAAADGGGRNAAEAVRQRKLVVLSRNEPIAFHLSP